MVCRFFSISEGQHHFRAEVHFLGVSVGLSVSFDAQATMLQPRSSVGILGASAALIRKTFKFWRLGWEIRINVDTRMQSQRRHHRCTERARLDTTCPIPTSPCVCGACVSRRARSVLLLFSPQVLSVPHLRITPSPSIHGFSVVRGRGGQRPSRSGGPCQAWRPTATNPKPQNAEPQTLNLKP